MPTTSESSEQGGSLNEVTLPAEPSPREAHVEVGTPESVDSDAEHHQAKPAAHGSFFRRSLLSSAKEDEDYLGDGCIVS